MKAAMMRFLLGLSCTCLLLTIGCGTFAFERESVDFKFVQQKAESLSKAAYVPPVKIPSSNVIEKLTLQEYQNISLAKFFLWQEEKLPFEASFYPLGYIYDTPVKMNEFKGDYTQAIRYSTNFFNLRANKKIAEAMPSDAGYAGFRLLNQINKPHKFDEFISFLGGSYLRAVGRENTYGLSSRGISINTLVSSKKEEFPNFIEFWLGKPAKDAKNVIIYALLNGESVTGAYEFNISPGDVTTVNVRLVLYLRKKVDVLGLCTMTSFFWFGENSADHFNDYRPEAHDSDGLMISAEKNTNIWQPLENYVGKSATMSNYHYDKINYFGLIQRDRDYEHYLDPDTSYNKEPNLWITPGTTWGPGTIRLLELPTDNDKMDNIVLLWVPDTAPVVGQAFNFDYTMHWSMNNPPIGGIATVDFTRHGVNHDNQKQTFFVVDFKGDKLEKLSSVEPVTAVAKISKNAKLVGTPQIIKDISNNSWRATLTIEEGNTVNNEPIDINCTLFYKGKKISETWMYKWRP